MSTRTPAKPMKSKAGQCYEIGYQRIQTGIRNAVLVHGIVTGRGPIEGIRYGHAWVEIQGYVVDPSGKVVPKELYYRIGEVSHEKKYTMEGAARRAVEHGHYGPWDPVIAAATHASDDDPS